MLQAIADFEKQVADSGVTLVDYSDKQQTTVAKDEMPLSPTECASINSCAAWAS